MTTTQKVNENLILIEKYPTFMLIITIIILPIYIIYSIHCIILNIETYTEFN